MASLFKENDPSDLPKIRKRKAKQPSKPVFIEMKQDQMMLLPPALDEMIAENHLVRTVKKVFELMNVDSLINTYKGGGRSAYNPKMLLVVLIYAYLMKIFTSRRIAKALREDITFMWLSGMNKPDFRTINLFRSGRLKKVIDEIFTNMVLYLGEQKYIKIENYFVDGTKIPADANKFSYVWAGNTKRYKKSRIEKIKGLLDQIDRMNQEENTEYQDRDLEEMGEQTEEITSEKLKEQVNKLNKIISDLGKGDKEKKKKIKKAVSELEKKHLPKLENYEQQERILEGRGSYSKTDTDATFFHMKTGERIPAYNVLMGTENQFVLNYTVHRKPSDPDNFIAHMEKFKQRTGCYPNAAIGDSAYGTEENYEYIEKHSIESYLKYGDFHREKENQKNPFHKGKFIYNPLTDSYACPGGRKLIHKEDQDRKTTTGYLQHFVRYKGNCKKCKFREQCTKSKQGRILQISHILEKHRNKARENLITEKGLELRKQRNVDVEGTFGNMKKNLGFTRFHLRGLKGAETEIGIMSLAHNTMKLNKLIN